jgi:hypothetical protein
VLTVEDVDLIIATVEDALEDILQRNEENQETLYHKIEKELKDIHQAIYSSRAVPIVPCSAKIVELVDDPSQLQWLADETKARLCQSKEEKDQDTEAMKQEKDEVLEKL